MKNKHKRGNFVDLVLRINGWSRELESMKYVIKWIRDGDEHTVQQCARERERRAVFIDIRYNM
jgi:hypothetical protein